MHRASARARTVRKVELNGEAMVSGRFIGWKAERRQF